MDDSYSLQRPHSASLGLLPALAALSALFGAPASAQLSPEATSALGTRISGRERGLALVDGELWAVGATYKALFERGGAMIVPPLGVDAPRSLPLWLALDSIWIGTKQLYAADGAAEPVQGELEVSYRHGELVTERFEVRTEALEHSFTLRELPVERGELVVRMRIDTKLVAYADGVGLWFEGAPGRGLRWSGLTAIDARGERAQGGVRLAGHVLEYVVPAAFLASAEAPLLLDPLIGGALDVSPGSGDFQNPDLCVGVEGGTGEAYCAVFERHWSATDLDVYGHEFDSDGLLVGSTLIFEPTIAQVAQRPAVARTGTGIGLNSGVIAVWQQGSSVSGTQSIVARAFEPSSGLTAAVTVSSGSGSHTDPDITDVVTTTVAGLSTRTQFVAWANNGIRGQVLDQTGLNGQVVLVGSQYVLSSGLIDTRPSVSVAFEFTDRVLVVWERFFSTPAPGDHDLIAALISPKTNVPIVFAKAILTSIGPDETRPRAAGHDVSNFDHPGWVSYTRGASSTSQDRDIYVMALTQDLTHNLDPSTPIAVKVASGSDDHDAAITHLEVFDISTVGSSRILNVAWVHEGGGPFGNVVNGAQLNESCKQGCPPPWTDWKLCETEHQVAGAPTGLVFANVEVAKNMAVYESLALGIFAQELGHAKIEGFGEFLGGGCSSGGTPWVECATAPNSNLAHTLEAATAVQPVFLILGFDRIDASCGSCTLVPDPFSGFVISSFTDSAGVAKVAMPLGSQASSLVGLEFFEQWASVPGGSPCAPLGATLSNAAKYEFHL